MYKHKSIAEIQKELEDLKEFYANRLERIVDVIASYDSYDAVPWANIANRLSSTRNSFNTSAAAVKEFDRQYQIAVMNGTLAKFMNLK
jgi:hypothetical protein